MEVGGGLGDNGGINPFLVMDSGNPPGMGRPTAIWVGGWLIVLTVMIGLSLSQFNLV